MHKHIRKRTNEHNNRLNGSRKKTAKPNNININRLWKRARPTHRNANTRKIVDTIESGGHFANLVALFFAETRNISQRNNLLHTSNDLATLKPQSTYTILHVCTHKVSLFFAGWLTVCFFFYFTLVCNRILNHRFSNDHLYFNHIVSLSLSSSSSFLWNGLRNFRNTKNHIPVLFPNWTWTQGHSATVHSSHHLMNARHHQMWYIINNTHHNLHN